MHNIIKLGTDYYTEQYKQLKIKTSMNKIIVLVFTLGMVLLLLIMLSIIFYVYTTTSNSDPERNIVPLASPVGTLYQCSDYICDAGRSCDSSGTCKLNLGMKCNISSDCIDGAYCSLVCVSRTIQPGIITGSPNSPCPCGDQMICNGGTCKMIAGAPCSNDTDCLSSQCTSNVCTSGSSLGNICSGDIDCITGNCSAGICQPDGVVTGTIDSLCGNSLCNQGLTCVSGVCTLINPVSIGQPCDSNSTCRTFNCSIGVCQPPGTITGQSGSTCINSTCDSTPCVGGICL